MILYVKRRNEKKAIKTALSLTEQQFVENRLQDVQIHWSSRKEEEQHERAQCQAALEVITTQVEYARDEVLRLCDAGEEEDLVARAAGLVEQQINRIGGSAWKESEDHGAEALL